MRKKFGFIIALCLLLTVFTGCSGAPEDSKPNPTLVTTQNGQIQGALKDDIVSFKGVPFAAPPLLELRFAPPKPTSPWEGVLDCTEFKPAPLQVKDGEVIGDEDCLYLNIWAPEDALDGSEKEKLPVLVFIHGGAYSTGTASKATYAVPSFAEDDIIYVTVEYRLNAFGYLALSEMEEESGYMGNMGTLDQIQSLKWIKDNIEAFGGDSENITICGESAGAMSVSNLILSPLSDGLFQKAIMESGSLFGQPILSGESSGNIEESLALGQAFMKSVGAESLADLRQMDGEDLALASAFSLNMTKSNSYSFMPVFDGKIIDSTPYESLQSGKYSDVKIMTGYNTDESTMFVPEGVTDEEYAALVKHLFGGDAQKVLDRFPVDTSHSATNRARSLVKAGFQIGCKIFGDAYSSQGKDIYIYNFDYNVDKFDQMGLGVGHGLEMYFVFDSLPKDVDLPEGGEDFQEAIHDYWEAFVKTGNPNNEDAPSKWPKYTASLMEVLQLNSQFNVIPAENAEDIDFYTELLWK